MAFCEQEQQQQKQQLQQQQQAHMSCVQHGVDVSAT
jgi:hypothetical protein